MIAIGIDIGKSKHAVAIIDAMGRSLCKTGFYKNNREGVEQMRALFAEYAPNKEETIIGMEATGGYGVCLRNILIEAGYCVHVINPLVSSASISGDIRGRKNDKRDALVIAQTVLRGDTESFNNTDVNCQQLVILTRHREFLVHQRSDIKRNIQSSLDEAFPEFHTLVNSVFSKFSMELLLNFPTAKALASAKPAKVAKIVSDNTRGKDAKAEAERLINSAKESIAVLSKTSDAHVSVIKSAINEIRYLTNQIKEMEAEIESYDMPELGKKIATIKGAGQMLPKIIAAEFGDIARFAVDPKTGRRGRMYKRLLAYAGSEPRIRESGNWRGQTHMSKRGSGSLRTALIQIAFTISRNDDHFRSVYTKHINRGKHHMVALSYVAANLLEIICSLWQSKRAYTIENPNSKSQLEPLSI